MLEVETYQYTQRRTQSQRRTPAWTHLH